MQVRTYAGSWQEIGRAFGASQAHNIRHHLSRGTLSAKLRKLLPQQVAFLRRAAPDQLDCLYGLAEGAGVPLERAVAIHSWEYHYLYATSGFEHCTSILVRDGKSFTIAHNEDEDPSWQGALRLARFRPKGGQDFLALHYAGQLPGASIGVNRVGIAFSMDNLWEKRSAPCIGLPQTFLGLLLLQAKTPSDVLRLYRQARVNGGFHELVATGTKAWSHEFFPGRKVRQAVRPGFAHANHPVWKPMQAGSVASVSSRRRLAAASQAKLTREGAVACLRTPLDRGGALQPKKKKEDMTLATLIAQPSKSCLEVWTARGWKKVSL